MLQIQTSRGQALPSRVLYYGEPGTGKTTFGAYAPSPLFLTTPRETGLMTLTDYGRVPETPVLPVTTWTGLINTLNEIAGTKDEFPYKTLVLDVVNGAEEMLREHVTSVSFKGDPKAFGDFGKGWDAAVPVWEKLFAGLDKVRAAKKVGVILLGHGAVKRTKNPDGDDYDRHVVAINDKLHLALSRWSDITLFARRETLTEKDGLRAKARTLGGLCLYTQEGATHMAKNRVGLPALLEVPEGDPADTWGVFAAALKVARKKGHAAPKEAPPPADKPANPFEADAVKADPPAAD